MDTAPGGAGGDYASSVKVTFPLVHRYAPAKPSGPVSDKRGADDLRDVVPSARDVAPCGSIGCFDGSSRVRRRTHLRLRLTPSLC